MNLDEKYLHMIIMEQISVVPNIYNIMWLFNEYNKKCFGGCLPLPTFSLVHSKRTLGRFICDFYDDDEMENPRIEISDSYEYTEDRLRDILVHEMIHYYLAYTGEDIYLSHGKEFKNLANYFNTNFGMNITKTIDITNMKRTNQGKNWFSKLFS